MKVTIGDGYLLCSAWIRGRGYECPSASTIGAILAREGFIAPTRRKERAGEYSDGLTAQDAPNAVWGADFKGWFKLRREPEPLFIALDEELVAPEFSA